MYTAGHEARVGAVTTAAPAIAVIGVSKRIAGRVLLDDVSLTIARGCIHGLLGPNGSGKTSLLRILGGLWSADHGHVERYDTPLEAIGYVPQRLGLYDELTAHENLVFQGAVRGVDRFAVARAENDFDLRELRDRRAGRLSGGERQRLSIAAAVMHRPRLLLLDEPTTALDAPSRRTLWAWLHREIGVGTAVVITTHEQADAGECHTTTLLRDGRVVAPDVIAADAVL